MTDDRSLERAARSWLEEGPTRAPDRTVDAALLRIHSTDQERGLRIPWRYQHMINPSRIAAGAAAVVVVALLVITLLPDPPPDVGSQTSGPTLSPSATSFVFPPRTSTPAVLTEVGPLAAGDYTTGPGFPVRIELPVPDGWSVDEVRSKVTLMSSEDASLGFWIVEEAYSHPCDSGGVVVTAVDADDLAAALAGAPGFDTTSPGFKSIGGGPDGVDGGLNDRAARYVELIGPLAGCKDPELWRTSNGDCRCMERVVERNRLWIIDSRYAGGLLVIDVVDRGETGTPAAALAELEDMIDSIRIGAPIG